MQKIFRTDMVKAKSRWIGFFGVYAALLFSSCANIVAPSGGPVDNKPPEFVKSEPKNRAVAFADKKLIITFDEFVSLSDPANKIVVSPPLKNNPEYRSSGKSVIVSFKESLKDSTTYTLIFGDCIQDITENNPASGFRFAFSTGSYADSLTLRGNVINAFTLEGEKDVLIMLYRKTYDSIPYKEIPDYLAKTSTDGSFEISNLAPGNYLIFSLRDANYNYLFDQPNERIAFYDSLVIPQFIPFQIPSSGRAGIGDSIVADTTRPLIVKSYLLYMFEQADTNQRLLKVLKDQPGQFKLIFKWPVTNLQLIFLKKPLPNDWMLEEYGICNDTVTYWVKDIKTDSLFLQVYDRGRIIDTLEIGLKLPSDSLKNQNNKGGKGSLDNNSSFKFLMMANASKAKPFDLNRQLKIRFLHPLRDFELAKIILKEMKDSIGKEVIPIISFSDSLIKRNLCIDYSWKKKTRYELFIPPSAFTDIYGFKNDSLLLNFITTEPEDYGLLKVNLKTVKNSGPYIFQLLSDNKSVLREVILDSAGILKLDFLNAANYNARIICDRNKNGKWDTGNYLKKNQPEKIYYYPGNIGVKANWDTEIDWEF